ncbi:Cytochrome b-562 [Hartmannibacter diazotrophicus]|uniref:Cytochrome b-562 n=1 Tax=Hartmannibacter diazotrophicus TaxID=1482074 RepID=A0A2C9DBY6_9HYPH|nr:cytochrome b [Hartmannibacter diazotrophicus]SON57834.1 Cytochrome b-562 [Hartmannibacter diazotrophicus]
MTTATAASPRPASYSALQIALHWIIAALILFQLVFGESMGRLGWLLRNNQTPTATDYLMADLHIYVGVAVLVLALWRLMIRVRHGAPAAPEGGNPLLEKAATAMHHLFYVLLIGMPVTGLIAEYLFHSMGEIHELGKPVFIIFIVVHAAAALYHQYVLKDGVLTRMLRPN